MDGRKLNLDTVVEYESELRNGRLWMRFVVPFSQPVDATASRLSYAVYDPTYYIEILHLKDDVIAFRGPAGGRCSGTVVPPNPTTETVMLAQALDRNAKPDNALGRLFAERVKVTCGR